MRVALKTKQNRLKEALRDPFNQAFHGTDKASAHVPNFWFKLAGGQTM